MPKTERDRQVMEWMTGHLSPSHFSFSDIFSFILRKEAKLCTNSKIFGLAIKFDKVLYTHNSVSMQLCAICMLV